MSHHLQTPAAEEEMRFLLLFPHNHFMQRVFIQQPQIQDRWLAEINKIRIMKFATTIS